MKFSVIIPTLNEEHYVGSLLQDLSKQTLQPFEVIVVDGGSQDATQKVVKKFTQVRLVTSQARVGKQRSLGGQIAQGDWLVFLDADVRVPKNFLKTAENLLSTTTAQIACPIYTPLTKSYPVKMLFSLLNGIFKLGEKHFPAGAGPCIFVKQSLFKTVKSFRSELLYDDLEFIHRAGRRGGLTILSLEVFVSDRRFRKYGTWQTIWQYTQVSTHFISGKLHKANQLKYPFGTFSHPQPK